MTNVPSATVGSPRSNRQSVSRLTKSRPAMSLVEMPRLRRASAQPTTQGLSPSSDRLQGFVVGGRFWARDPDVEKLRELESGQSLAMRSSLPSAPADGSVVGSICLLT